MDSVTPLEQFPTISKTNTPEIWAITNDNPIMQTMEQDTEGKSVPETLLLKGIEHIKESPEENPPDLTELRREFGGKRQDLIGLLYKADDPKQNLRLEKDT